MQHGRYPRMTTADDDAPAPLPIDRYRARPGGARPCDAISQAERALESVQAKLTELDALADEARRADAIPFSRATWRRTDDDGPWAA